MLEFTFDYPALQTGYGVNLSSLAATEALRNGYTVYDSITIAPNKKLEDADIPKGSLLCSYNQGSGIWELYLDMDRYVTIHKNYFSLENTNDNPQGAVPTASSDYADDEGLEDLDEEVVTNHMIELLKTKTDDPLNPNKALYKIISISFWHKSTAAALEYKTQLLLKLQEVKVSEKDTRITFWYQTTRGPSSYQVALATPEWKDIRHNYNSKLRENLDQLINYDLSSNNGSIILLHGPAGTGKSFFIRSLVHAWKKTCQVNYVIDSDNLFDKNSADYLVQMMCLPKATGKYSILIMEDSGEMIAKDAKLMMGQAMSRMLNLADGILGQGGKNILLISTNEELKDLNEAASRPGRCFAKLKFEEFPAEEAYDWLLAKNIDSPVVDSSKSLAELYEILNTRQIANKTSKRIGF